ncbi:MAG: CtsR family transcriptional regulator [Clostridia bacterium]|nr:CtsR family transcriptional regulator [Clostridia bacterium]
MSLSRRIEEHLKMLLEQGDAIEVRRSELAETFNCVPSQINYVLSTRFTHTQGYLVESRRGGGGYLRIVKLFWDTNSDATLKEIYKEMDIGIAQREAEGVLKRFCEEEYLTKREYNMLKAVVSRGTLAIELPERDYIRAKIMQAVIMFLCRNDYK